VARLSVPCPPRAFDDFSRRLDTPGENRCGTPVALIDSQSVARTLRELEASPAAPAPSVTPTALDDAQIDALFDLSRMREQDRQHDVLAVGVAALASVIGGWLASR